MDFSSADVPISRETWAPRSPRRDESKSDTYVPPHAREAGAERERDGDHSRRSASPPPVRKSFETAPRRPQNAPAAEPNPVLGVFGLSIRTRERDLEDEFGRYGEVERVVIVYDQRINVGTSAHTKTDRSRGFGFITMRDTKDAAVAIEKLNGLNLHGRNIRVDYSATHKPHAPTPGQYMGEKRPVLEDRYGGRGGDRFAGRYDDRRGGDRYGGDRYGGDRYDRYDRRGGDRHDDRRDDRREDRRDDRRPRRDYDDPYGGRSKREDDRERRRSPSPRRSRYSASPDRRAATPRDYDSSAPALESEPKY